LLCTRANSHAFSIADSNLEYPSLVLPSSVMTITLNVQNVGTVAGEEVRLL
jgi:hypothetical protein